MDLARHYVSYQESYDCPTQAYHNSYININKLNEKTYKCEAEVEHQIIFSGREFFFTKNKNKYLTS